MKKWDELVASLELTGAAKELLAAATLTGFDAIAHIRLQINPAHKILFTPSVIEKIAVSFQNDLQMKVHLEVELEEENAVVMGRNINQPEGLQ